MPGHRDIATRQAKMTDGRLRTGGAYVPAFFAVMYAPFRLLSATGGRRHAIKPHVCATLRVAFIGRPPEIT
jgi:hypothetical protein